MKMKIAIASSMLLFTVTAVTYAAASNEQYKGYSVVHVTVNGKNVSGEVPGINFDGTTLVPLRLVSESLGAKVQWDGQTSTASVVLASPQEPELTPEQVLYDQIIDRYNDILIQAEALEEYREKIRIAKEFYEIRGEDYNLRKIKVEGFSDTDLWLSQAITAGSELTTKAFGRGMDVGNMNKALAVYTDSLSAYKDALGNLINYADQKQDFFLDYYILQYSEAYNKETELIKLVKKEIKEIQNKRF
jgi:hypothetical protein